MTIAFKRFEMNDLIITVCQKSFKPEYTISDFKLSRIKFAINDNMERITKNKKMIFHTSDGCKYWIRSHWRVSKQMEHAKIARSIRKTLGLYRAAGYLINRGYSVSAIAFILDSRRKINK